MTDDLEIIVGQSRTVTVLGEDIDISPLKVRDIPPFARALKPITEQLGAMLQKRLDVQVIADLAVNGEGLIDAVSIACGKPSELIGDLDLDDFLLLAMAVLEVNADFFSQRLMPVLNRKPDQADGSMSDRD